LDAISDDGSVNGRRLRLRLAASQPEPVSHRATIYRSASPVWFQPTARPRRTPISLPASPVRLEAAADRTSFSLPASPLWFRCATGPTRLSRPATPVWFGGRRRDLPNTRYCMPVNEYDEDLSAIDTWVLESARGTLS
jgi:hypothetical protein